MSTNNTIRLGLSMSGTNLELKPLRDPKKDGKGSGEEDSDENEASEDKNGKGSGEGEDSDEDGDQDGSGSGEEGNGDESGDGPSGENGEGSDSDGSEGSDSDGSEGDAEGNETPKSGGSKDAKGGKGAGSGGTRDRQEQIQAAQAILAAMEAGAENGLLDNNSAMQAAFKDEVDEPGDRNEASWRPYDGSVDEVQYAPFGDVGAGRALRQSVKKEVSSLAAKLRTKFLEARRKQTLHGVRKGRGLSDRRLVSTFTEIKSGVRPTRPDWTDVQKQDVTLASAVVIDQSGSMSSRRIDAARAGLAISEPLDRLGSPNLVVGPRDNGKFPGGRWNSDLWQEMTDENGRPIFHRMEGVTVDIFKDWDETIEQVYPRFTRVQAMGGTPLSDGIQYAMQELSHRKERYRVIFVVTDGAPNNSPVVRRQIRLAAEAGVFIVGVGIGPSCGAVTALFPLHVHVPTLSALPTQMLKVLTEIMFPKRGRKIALDGKFEGRLTTD